ncbi:MAG: flagellar protein FlaG [Methylovulum sp.]|nr:flagellar protein FlaG [Methylovulum sp.]
MDISINNVANVVAIPKRMANTEKYGQEGRNLGQDTVPLAPASGVTGKVSRTSNESSDMPNEQLGKAKEQVDNALKNINDFFQMSKRTMQFSINEDTGKMIVEIKDEKTGEVIRQIPSEEVLQLEKKLDEVQGLLFSKKA